jgi:hypothetical protein
MNLLERDDLGELLTGCIRTEQTDSGLRFHRLTERQVAHFEEANESWGVRANCSAGVQLKIVTDSRILDLTGRILPGARQYAGLDVEVDGRVIGSHRFDASDETRDIRLVEFSMRHEREITVTFPQSAIPDLDALNVEDDASVRPQKRKHPRYLAIGDSITQGMDARGPASAYPVQLTRMLSAELLNLGVGGHIFDIDSLDADLPFAPDIVTVAYGTNDWSREISREDIGETVTAYLTRLSEIYPDADIYVLTPIWRENGNEVRAGGTLVEFSSAIARAASTFGRVTIIDGTTLVPNRSDLLPDGTHPNDEGFLHYAINLRRSIG